MIYANTIDDVVMQLDDVILWSRKHKSRIGYFAVLYKKMTLEVQRHIADKTFEDGKRMEKLDVIFANRYLQAWWAYTNKEKCSSSWCTTFDFTSNNRLIVLQHLLLGISAHINLDLAIAAAETSPGVEIHDLQKDFEKINDIIETLAQSIQETLSNIWFPLKALTKISNGKHDAVINFSITAARQASWASAVSLATFSGAARENYIGMIDKTVANVAARIARPGFTLGLVLSLVCSMETKDVNKIIDILEQ